MKFPKKPYICATQITLFWSDKPDRGEICQHDHPEGWDEWLAEIEAERNEEEEEIEEKSEEDLEIIDEVINSLYDDYESEQDYAQRVIGAWVRIRDQLRR